MRLLPGKVLMLWVLSLLPGCTTAPAPVFHTVAWGPRDQVLVVTGPSGCLEQSPSLQAALAQGEVPLGVETFEGSPRAGQLLPQHPAPAQLVAAGQRLARQLVQRRQDQPEHELYLLGHGEGCGVILAALEALPPHVRVDGVVLVLPAVSADHDLRPALQAVRLTLDVLYRQQDPSFLGLSTLLAGTAARHGKSPSAARAGFLIHPETLEDLVLFEKLRQQPWHPTGE